MQIICRIFFKLNFSTPPGACLRLSPLRSILAYFWPTSTCILTCFLHYTPIVPCFIFRDTSAILPCNLHTTCVKHTWNIRVTSVHHASHRYHRYHRNHSHFSFLWIRIARMSRISYLPACAAIIRQISEICAQNFSNSLILDIKPS